MRFPSPTLLVPLAVAVFRSVAPAGVAAQTASTSPTDSLTAAAATSVLLREAAAGNAATALAALNAGARVDTADAAGDTPLHWAAGVGSETLVLELLRAGADLESRDNGGWTPLFYAVRSGDLDKVAALLEAGADENARDAAGRGPLDQATEEGHLNVARLLVAVGASPDAVGPAFRAGPTAGVLDMTLDDKLIIAAFVGRRDRLGALLAAGADPAAGGAGVGPLTLALLRGHANVVDLLLPGADPRVAGPGGNSLAFAALAHDRLDLLGWLLHRGAAGPTQPISEAEGAPTLLEEAEARGRAEAAELIRYAGRVGSLADSADAEAPVAALAHAGLWDAVARALEAGARAYQCGACAAGALHYAASAGDTAAVKLLLGSSPLVANDQDRGGRTPLQLAREAGHGRVVDLLVSTLVDSGGATGATALADAVARGRPAALEAFLQGGLGDDDARAAAMAQAAATDRDDLMLILWSHGIPLPAAEGLSERAAALVAALDTVDASGVAFGVTAAEAGGEGAAAAGPEIEKKDEVISSYVGTEVVKASVAAGNARTLAWALGQEGVEVDDPYREGPYARGQLRALHVAALRDDTVAVARLLDAGADPFAVATLDPAASDGGRRTPFRLAVDSGAVHAARLLAGPEARLGIRDDEGLTSLEWALANRHPEAAEALLDAGASLDAPEGLWDAVHYAARDGHGPALHRMLAQGADPDRGPDDAWRPLVLAAYNDRGYEALSLMAFGASPLRPGPEGSAAEVAEARGHLALAAALRAGAPSPGMLLSHAARARSREHVKALLAAGAPADGDPAFPSAAEAAAGGDLETLALLLDAGADPDAPGVGGWTPLHYAARDGNYPLMRRLLDAGADPGRPKADGWTPLHLAAHNGKVLAAFMLLEGGADPDPLNDEGKTPAQLAAASENAGKDELAAYLREPRPEPYLAEAAWAGLDDVVGRLLDQGVSPDARTLWGRSAASMAASEGRTSTVRLLVEHGASLEGEAGISVLTNAAQAGDTATVQLLLGLGVAPDGGLTADGSGVWVPVSAAVRGNQPETLRLLLDAGAAPQQMVGVALADAPLRLALDSGFVEVARLLAAAAPATSPDWGATSAPFRFLSEGSAHPTLALASSWALDPALAAAEPSVETEVVASLLALEGPAVRDVEDPRVRAVTYLARGAGAWPGPFREAVAAQAAMRGWGDAYAVLAPALSDEGRAAAMVWAAAAGQAEAMVRVVATGTPASVTVSRTRSGAKGRDALSTAEIEGKGREALMAIALGADPGAGGFRTDFDEDRWTSWPALVAAVARPDRGAALVGLAGGVPEPVLAYLDALERGQLPPIAQGTAGRVMARALLLENLGMVRALLARGVPESDQGLADQLALYDAAAGSEPAALRRLLDAGVDPSAPLIPVARPLSVALSIAQSEGLQQAALLLLQSGAPPSDGDAPGRPALIRASVADAERVALSLLDHGAPADVRDAQGRSALEHAAANGQLSLVRALLARGVSPRALPDEGPGVLELAAQRGNGLVVWALRCAGAPRVEAAREVARSEVIAFLDRPDCRPDVLAEAMDAGASVHDADLNRGNASAAEAVAAALDGADRLERLLGPRSEPVRRARDLVLGRFEGDVGGFQGEGAGSGSGFWDDGDPDAAEVTYQTARSARAQGTQWLARTILEELADNLRPAYGRDPSSEGLMRLLRVDFERVDLLVEQGDVAEARRTLDETFAQLPGAFRKDVFIHALAAGAHLALAEGHGEGAASVFRAARDSLALYEIPGGRSMLVTLLEREARARAAAGQDEAARAVMARALALGRSAWGPGTGRMALALGRAAGMARLRGSPTAATLYARAAAEAEGLYPLSTVQARIRLQAAMADTASLSGDDATQRFIELSRAAGSLEVAAGSEVRYLPLAARRAYLDQDYALVRDGLLAGMRQIGGDRSSLATTLYGQLLPWKGYLVTTLVDDRERLGAASGPNPDLVETQRLLANVRGDLGTWVARRSGVPTLEWRAGIDRLTQRKEELERDLAMQLPRLAGREDLLRGSPAQRLAEELAPDEAWVDVYRYGSLSGGEAYGAFVLRGGAAVRYVDLGPAPAVDRAAGRWREAVLRGSDADGEWAEVRARLWGPLAEPLDGVLRVWMGSDGALARLPLSLLPEGADTRVAGVGSIRELLRLRADTAAVPATSLLVVGDPDFGVPGSGAPAFAPLPGTAVEAKAIADLGRRAGLSVETMEKGGATEDAVLSALPHYSVVHLATHGFFAAGEAGVGSLRSSVVMARASTTGGADRNPLVESGLALAGANLPGVSGAGTLTAEELLGQDLSGVRLVVLSACETGRGAEVTGQGVLGLQTSFLASGARTMLMSLWKVPDASTAMLMERFYQGLLQEKRSPADALVRAQAAVRADPRYAAPVNWAAWVLVGDAFQAPQ